MDFNNQLIQKRAESDSLLAQRNELLTRTQNLNQQMQKIDIQLLRLDGQIEMLVELVNFFAPGIKDEILPKAVEN